ncbi:MAG: thioredoxin [Thermoanaerobaculia bacterium]
MEGTLIRCPECGRTNRIPPNAAGKTVVCGGCKSALQVSGGRPVALDRSSFDGALQRPEPLVVDFWAGWCGPCRVVAPVIEELARERRDVIFGKVDVDANQEIAARFRVSGIPTLIFFRGGSEVGRLVGAVPRSQIEQAIGQYFSKSA